MAESKKQLSRNGFDPKIQQHELISILARLSRHVAALGRPRDLAQCSGVFIRHAKKHFVATAKHCIINDGPLEKPRIISFKRQVGAHSIGVGASYVHPRFDLALVELEPWLAERMDAEWLDIEDLHEGRTPIGKPAVLVGFPNFGARRLSVNERTGVIRSRRRGALDIRPMAALTVVASDSEIPTVFDEDPWSTRTHLHFRVRVASESPDEYVAALGGISGAGVFSNPPLASKSVFALGRPKLLGIETGLKVKERLARCVRASVLRALIEDVVAGQIRPRA